VSWVASLFLAQLLALSRGRAAPSANVESPLPRTGALIENHSPDKGNAAGAYASGGPSLVVVGHPPSPHNSNLGTFLSWILKPKWTRRWLNYARITLGRLTGAGPTGRNPGRTVRIDSPLGLRDAIQAPSPLRALAGSFHQDPSGARKNSTSNRPSCTNGEGGRTSTT